MIDVQVLNGWRGQKKASRIVLRPGVIIIRTCEATLVREV